MTQRYKHAPSLSIIDAFALDWMRGRAIRVTEVSGCACPNCDCSRLEEEFLISADKVVDLALAYRDRVHELIDDRWSEQYDQDLDNFPNAAFAKRQEGVLVRAEWDAREEVFGAAGLFYLSGMLADISRFLLRFPQIREMRIEASRSRSLGDNSEAAALLGACADAVICADVIVEIDV